MTRVTATEFKSNISLFSDAALNKPVIITPMAFMAAVSFLELNSRSLRKAKGYEHAEMMEQLGQGKISREEVATYLRDHSA